MARNKVRLFLKSPNGAEHVYMNIWQMYPEKSVYFTSLLKKEKVNVGYVSGENSITIAGVVPFLNKPKISVHTSGKIHVKTADSKIILKYKILPIEKLDEPQEICTIFPSHPLAYPLRKGKRKLDTELDLGWIKKGVFGLKIYLVKPVKPERTINSLLIPVDTRFPKGTQITTIYKTYREFGFYMSLYQTPKLTSFNFNRDEHWIFNIPKDTEKQPAPTIIDKRIFERDGKKIEISKPNVELNKVE